MDLFCKGKVCEKLKVLTRINHGNNGKDALRERPTHHPSPIAHHHQWLLFAKMKIDVRGEGLRRECGRRIPSSSMQLPERVLSPGLACRNWCSCGPRDQAALWSGSGPWQCYPVHEILLLKHEGWTIEMVHGVLLPLFQRVAGVRQCLLVLESLQWEASRPLCETVKVNTER